MNKNIDELVLELNNIQNGDNNIEHQIKEIIQNKTKISIMTNDTIIRILVAFILKMKECEEAKQKLEAENKSKEAQIRKLQDEMSSQDDTNSKLSREKKRLEDLNAKSGDRKNLNLK